MRPGQRPVSRVWSQACLTCPSPSVRLPKQLSPGWPGLDLLLASGPAFVRRSLSQKYASRRLASGPVPQPACWRVLRVCDWPQAQPASGPSVYETGPSSNPPKHSSARPAQVPGATSSVVRLPGSQQPTHGFAASWLRLASGPAQPATHLSPACPAQAPAHLRACQPLGRPFSSQTSRLSPACQGQVCLTCLRLASGQRPVSRV